jgi:hypothetical protein
LVTVTRGSPVGPFGRRRGAAAGGYWQAKDETIAYLDAFVGARRGVEVYVEPATVVTETTVALVAHDGEWTRRRIGSPKAAVAFGKRHSIPVYDAAVRGYPPRMRAWTAEQSSRRNAMEP